MTDIALAVLSRFARLEVGSLGNSVLRNSLRALPAVMREKLSRAISDHYNNRFNLRNDPMAQMELLKISRMIPSGQYIFVTILSFAVYPDTNRDIVDFVTRTASREVLSRPEIGLQLLFVRIKDKNFTNAAEDLLTIPYRSVEADPILRDIWRICCLHLIVNNDKSYFDRFDPAGFANLIAIETHPNVLFDVLANLFHKAIPDEKRRDVIERISNIRFDSSQECFSIVYFYLMSGGFTLHAESLGRLNACYTQGVLHPMYLRAKLCPLSVLGEERSVWTAELSAAANDDTRWLWRNSDLQRSEFAARVNKQAQTTRAFRTVSTSDEVHVLVAFFGQLRFATETLPALKKWVEDNLPKCERKMKITYGVSTWRETGSKVIEYNDSFSNFQPYFPETLARSLDKLRLSTVADAFVAFPNFSASVMHKLRASVHTVDERCVTALLGGQVYFDISEDERFMRDIGLSISRYAPDQISLLNQGRMIDRIGSIENIVHRVETDSGPVTHVFFVRPDLSFISGSIERYYDAFRRKSNWVIADQDTFAQFVEGIGDRFMLADRQAAEHIFSMKDRVQRIFRDEPLNKLACSRLAPHQMLATVLLENAVAAFTVPRSELNWKLVRRNAEDFIGIEELVKDAGNMTNVVVKNDILAGLRKAGLLEGIPSSW